MALTELKCKNAKPKKKPYKLADSGGMYLEVMPNGSKYWRLKYRFMGKEKRLALGVYPRTSLSEARDKREKARKVLEAGTDPSFAKKEEKRRATLKAAHTFEVIAREWHGNQLPTWTPGYGKYVLQRLDSDIFPAIGQRPVTEISAPELLDALRKIENRGVRELTHRTMQTCGQIFRYAIATGRAERNPVPDLRGALKPMIKKHYAALEAKDLPDFLKALERNDARLYPQTQRALRLLMLTFVRTRELINASWDEIDFEAREWRIPAERMKMRRPHLVPLSKQALAILKEQHELTGNWKWVFPNMAHPKKSMSNNTLLGALGRLGYKGKTTGHGFRALAMSTIKEQLGYRHEVIDLQLAHAKKNKIIAAYDRAEFLDERKTMMQRWADLIDVAASGGKVVAGNFKKRA